MWDVQYVRTVGDNFVPVHFIRLINVTHQSAFVVPVVFAKAA
jgi:hypothetical protein